MAGLGPVGRQSAEDWVKVALKVLITKWLRRGFRTTYRIHLRACILGCQWGILGR